MNRYSFLGLGNLKTKIHRKKRIKSKSKLRIVRLVYYLFILFLNGEYVDYDVFIRFIVEFRFCFSESICLKLESEKYVNDDSEEFDSAILENPNHRTNHVYDDEEVTSSESENSSCEENEIEKGKKSDEHCYRVDET